MAMSMDVTCARVLPPNTIFLGINCSEDGGVLVYNVGEGLAFSKCKSISCDKSESGYAFQERFTAARDAPTCGCALPPVITGPKEEREDLVNFIR